MKQERIHFTGNGGVKLQGIIWLPDNAPRALLQITHGMTEHIGRYTKLAASLTAQGIAAAGFDLRGHGANPGDPACASFGEGGWDASLEDMHLFRLELTERFGAIPHFMLGFSLGSFLLREYLGLYDDKLAGAAILGTGCQPGAVLSLMMAIVKGQIRKMGFDRTTPLVRKLSFETYNRQFAPNRTASDWLCADQAELDAYIADPLCRADISAGLFWQLLDSMKRTGSAHSCDSWDKTLPVLLMSGQDDPVGSSGRGVEQVKQAMTRAGLAHVAMHLFKGARHDLLHEEVSGCAGQARKILLDWMMDVIA